jgi:hypothetical protein
VRLSLSSANNAILRFDDLASLRGKVIAATGIAGDRTLLDMNMNTAGMALDPVADRLFVLTVSTMSGSAILVFDHISTRSGNTPYDRVITGAANKLSSLGPIALDPIRDVLYAIANRDAGLNAGIVTFKHASAASGNVPPNSILQMRGAPAGAIKDLALDAANDRLFMLMDDQRINVMDNVSTLASGTLAPDRVITSKAGFTRTTRIALDPAGRLLVGNISGFNGKVTTPGSIAILANAATANGDVSPVATISGSLTGLNVPRAMTVVTSPGSSSGGDLYVNVDCSTVLVFKNIATTNGNVAPDHMFTVASKCDNGLVFSLDTSR